MTWTGPADIAFCPEHGLHGCRTTCFTCGGPVEQVRMVPVALQGTPGRLTDAECSMLGAALAVKVWPRSRLAMAVAPLIAAARADSAREAGDWQQKWKRRGVVIERLKAERDQARRESAEHLALLDGKTARLLAEDAIARGTSSEGQGL